MILQDDKQNDVVAAFRLDKVSYKCRLLENPGASLNVIDRLHNKQQASMQSGHRHCTRPEEGRIGSVSTTTGADNYLCRSEVAVVVDHPVPHHGRVCQ